MAALMGDRNHYIDAVYYYMRRYVVIVMGDIILVVWSAFHHLIHSLVLRVTLNKFMTRILKSFRPLLVKEKEGAVKME